MKCSYEFYLEEGGLTGMIPAARRAELLFDRYSGRGQILGGDRRVYWTHRKELVGARTLETGQRVVFIPTEAPCGPRALAVRPLEVS